MDLAPVLAATKVDTITFALTAVIILSGALGVVLARNPVHAALMLVQTLFGVAVSFVSQGAHFLAAVQVIVYAGAIVVLFLFVIMLLGVDREESIEAEPLRNQRPIAVILGVIVIAELLLLQPRDWTTGAPSVVGALSGPAANVEQLARVLFTRYLFAFEATSILLVIAVVAAVALARRSSQEPDLDADLVAESDQADAEAQAAAEARKHATVGAAVEGMDEGELPPPRPDGAPDDPGEVS